MTTNGPPGSAFSKLLFFGTRVMPIFFSLAAAQLFYANYFNPMTEEKRKEFEERQKQRDVMKTRLSKKREFTMEQRKQNLFVDDSQLFNRDDLADIDLSHLDQDIFSAEYSSSVQDQNPDVDSQ